jgi:hypothetical protein
MAAFKNIKLQIVNLRVFLNKTPSSLQLKFYRFKYNEAISVKSVLRDHPVGSSVVIKVKHKVLLVAYIPTKVTSPKFLYLFLYFYQLYFFLLCLGMGEVFKEAKKKHLYAYW